MGQSDGCANNSPNLLESEDIVDMADSLEQASTTQSSPKSREKEVPLGWISRLHTCGDKKLNYGEELAGRESPLPSNSKFSCPPGVSSSSRLDPTVPWLLQGTGKGALSCFEFRVVDIMI